MNDMNFNYSECIQKQHNFGETIVYNICTNETNVIKWGTDDWSGIILMYFLMITFIVLLIALAIDTIRH